MNGKIMLSIVLISGAVASAEVPAGYDVDAFCSDARWEEWRKIVAEAEGYPEDQDDVRSMIALNRRQCSEIKNGGRSLEELNTEYWRAFDAWIQRVKARQGKRDERRQNIEAS